MATKTSVAFKQSIAHLQSAQPLFIKKMVEMITKRFTVWDRTSVYTVLEKIHFAIIITMLHAWLSWLTFPGVTINTEIRSNFCCWIFVNKKGGFVIRQNRHVNKLEVQKSVAKISCNMHFLVITEFFFTRNKCNKLKRIEYEQCLLCLVLRKSSPYLFEINRHANRKTINPMFRTPPAQNQPSIWVKF